MSFPRYPEYKDSGVEWLGQVPEHWFVKKLKYRVKLLSEKSSEASFRIALENIESWSGRLIDTDSEYEGEGVAFSQGDVLFGKLRPYLAKILVAPRPGEAVGDFHVFRPSSETESSFLRYFMVTRSFIDVVDGATFGSKMPRANWDFVGMMPIVAPDRDGQKQIANFLDHETAKIDALITEQEKLIALLKEKRQAVISHAVTKGLDPNVKMKDSGVEWLGQVPEHWDVDCLKYRCEVFPSNIDKHLREDEPLVQLCNYTDVYYNEVITEGISFMPSTAKPEQIDKFRLRRDDVIITKDSESADDIAIAAYVPQDLPGVVCGYHLSMIRPRKSTSGSFVKRLFDSDYAKARFEISANGLTRVGLGQYALDNVKLPFPPHSEQAAIANFLDHATAKIDALIAMQTKAVGLLQERRSALISAAVTGQIDVRDFA